MARVMTAICCVCVLGASGLAAAQSGKMDKTDKGMMGKNMKVTGCVAQSADMSHFMLNKAMMSDMKGMKGDMKPMSYMLMGGELKAHVGHQVEVTGTMADDKMMGKDAMAKDKMVKDKMSKESMSTTDMHTLNVSSVKMIAATCP